MKRESKGSSAMRRGIRYAVLTLERGKRHGRRHWERMPEEITTDAQAEAYAAMLQARVDAGWNPKAASAAAPVDGVLVPAYVDAWLEGRSYDSAPKDRAMIARYLPGSPLANVRVRDCKPRNVIAWIRWLKAHASERGGTLAPRTIRSAYDVVRRAFDHAIVDEIATLNPCMAGPVSGELPTIEDKDPTAREGWEYSWAEIRPLVFDARIPIDRRVLNALRFATGARISELAVLRWRDWERDLAPLSRLTVRRARKSVSRTEGGTKTRAVKPCPVHPVLAAILAEWFDLGWELHYGRKPGPDDLVIPTATLAPRHESKANAQFKADCERVGVRVLSQHKARHTFVSRIQDDGADGSIVRWITHAPPKTAWDGYTRQQWGRLCAEVAKLRFPDPRAAGVDVGVDAPTGETRKATVASDLAWSGREDLKFCRAVSARLYANEIALSGDAVPTDGGAFGPLALTLSTPAIPADERSAAAHLLRIESEDERVLDVLERWEAGQHEREGGSVPRERLN